MPTLGMVIELEAFRHNGPPITDDEFLVPLAIAAGEVEAAWSWKEHWGGAGVRIVSVRSDEPLTDDRFDDWSADAFRCAVRFLECRPKGVFGGLEAAGLVNLRICVTLRYEGEFPIIDWPPELYAVCRRLDIGLVSTWASPEDTWPA